MASLYDELAERLRADPSLLRRSGPRQDIGLILFANREAIDELWKAAEGYLEDRESARGKGDEPAARLRAAVEKLRPVFGDSSV